MIFGVLRDQIGRGLRRRERGAQIVRQRLDEALAVLRICAELHRIRAQFHAALAADFGAADALEPLYLRLPDVDKARA